MLSDIAELGNQSAMDQLLKKGWPFLVPSWLLKASSKEPIRRALIGYRAGLRQIFDEFLGSSPLRQLLNVTPNPNPSPKRRRQKTDPFSCHSWFCWKKLFCEDKRKAKRP
jgi:hypothetical protein